MSRYKVGVNGMRRKKHSRRLVLAGILCLATIAGRVYIAFAPSNHPTGYAARGPKSEIISPTPPIVNYGLPVRLKIPEVAIDAPITYMGMTKTGAMAAPGNIVDVGWYKHGALPGNKGSAVLAGHIDGLKGQPGVFARLNELQKGDTLQVVDSNNATISFVVGDIQTYGPDEQPGEVFNAIDGHHLNLITCTGAWDNTQHRFMQRLVVFTEKI